MRTDRLLAIVVLAAGCASPTQTSPTAPPPPAASSSPTGSSTSAPPDRSGHGNAAAVPDPSPAPPPAPTTRSGAEAGPAMPVGELPPDLTNPPTTSPADAPRRDDHDVDGAAITPAGPADTATEWAITRSASRFDDPPGDRRRRLAGLAADPIVAADADLAAPRAPDGGAAWAIVTTVEALDDGWWRVTYTLKQTRSGQVGPTSTPHTLDVHVDRGLIAAERP